MMLDTISQLDAKPHTTPLASTSMALAALALLAQYSCSWQTLETYHADEQIAWFLQYCKAYEQASQQVMATHGFRCDLLLTEHPATTTQRFPSNNFSFGIRFAHSLMPMCALAIQLYHHQRKAADNYTCHA